VRGGEGSPLSPLSQRVALSSLSLLPCALTIFDRVQDDQVLGIPGAGEGFPEEGVGGPTERGERERERERER